MCEGKKQGQWGTKLLLLCVAESGCNEWSCNVVEGSRVNGTKCNERNAETKWNVMNKATWSK